MEDRRAPVAAFREYPLMRIPCYDLGIHVEPTESDVDSHMKIPDTFASGPEIAAKPNEMAHTVTSIKPPLPHRGQDARRPAEIFAEIQTSRSVPPLLVLSQLPNAPSIDLDD